jgi:adenylosuccinate lyase
MEAGAVVKGQGKPNDLLERISKDPAFKAIHDKLDSMIDPHRFVGRAPQQVDEFVAEEVEPVLQQHKDLLIIENVDSVNV